MIFLTFSFYIFLFICVIYNFLQLAKKLKVFRVV